MLWTYLLLTILLELPIFLLFWHKEGWGRAILFCILLNGFTNPLINLAIQTWNWNVYALEIAVVVTEMVAAILLMQGPATRAGHTLPLRARFTKALLFSFCANAFSYGVGLWLFWIGWLD